LAATRPTLEERKGANARAKVFAGSCIDAFSFFQCAFGAKSTPTRRDPLTPVRREEELQIADCRLQIVSRRALGA
jgi:hypothetical protein